jgi:hypothetical protein
VESKIFMCYVAGSGRTSRVHSTQEQADEEAKRLSGLPDNKGKKVYTLVSIAEHQTEKEANSADGQR